MTTGKAIRPPIKRFGGKYYLCKRIVALMPGHRCYSEPFAGGLSVLLNKPRSEHEYAGDLEAELMWFWKCLQDQPDELIDALERVPYTRACWTGWTTDPTVHEDPLDRAIAYLVRNRFSRGGLGKTFSWSDRLRGGKPGDENAWDTIRRELPAIAERVKGVQFYRAPAAMMIDKLDGPDTLHYLDPPYPHETRTTPRAYEYEMTPKGHAELLDVARGCRGVVMLSGYDNPMYAEALGDWTKVTWELPNHSGQGKSKQRRTECLWMNRPINVEATP